LRQNQILRSHIHKAIFRFYEELNDFLPLIKRKISFTYLFTGNPSVKDAIEALGAPHVEVDLILVNNVSVNFSYQLQNGDRVAVYPVFEDLDIFEVNRLRAKPLRDSKFILDVHLGKLARYLRMLGLDTLYENNYQDDAIIRIAAQQGLIILTRDVNLLKNKQVERGYWVRATQPMQQIKEILKRFDLHPTLAPFKRCL